MNDYSADYNLNKLSINVWYFALIDRLVQVSV